VRRGSDNVFLGYLGENFSTTGTFDTGVGYGPLRSNTTGADNTAMGANNLGLNTTGAENTAVGVGACLSNTTGTGHTCFGYDSDVVGQNLHNATAIGAHATVKVSDAIVLAALPA
jgi:hypothetical protein